MDHPELSARGNAFSHDDEKFAKFCKVEFEESIKKKKKKRNGKKEKREKRMIELAIGRFIGGDRRRCMWLVAVEFGKSVARLSRERIRFGIVSTSFSLKFHTGRPIKRIPHVPM